MKLSQVESLFWMFKEAQSNEQVVHQHIDKIWLANRPSPKHKKSGLYLLVYREQSTQLDVTRIVKKNISLIEQGLIN